MYTYLFTYIYLPTFIHTYIHTHRFLEDEDMNVRREAVTTIGLLSPHEHEEVCKRM